MLVALFLPAVAATVASTDRPIEPPTCWPTFSMALATPASVFRTCHTATVVSGTKMQPMPIAITIMPGKNLFQ